MVAKVGFVVNISAPRHYIFITLPNILYIVEDDVDDDKNEGTARFRLDYYHDGESIDQVQNWIEINPNTSSTKRILKRGQFILDILMTIYEAFKAGYIFTAFEADDIVFRNNLFCIRSYRHVIAVSHPDSPELLKVLKNFVLFYYRCWFMDSYFTEGDSDYFARRRLEKETLGKIQDWTLNDQINWEKLLADGLQWYKYIFEELCPSYCISTDYTARLLKAINRKIALNSSDKFQSSQIPTVTVLGSSGSGSSIEQVQISVRPKNEEKLESQEELSNKCK